MKAVKNKGKKKNKKNKTSTNKFLDLFNKIKKLVIDNKFYILMVLPFVLIQIFTSIFGAGIKYFNYKFYSVILFDACWILLFVILSLSFKGIIGKIIYIFSSGLFLILFLVNNVYFSMTRTFFDFSLIESAGEGAPYIFDAIKNCNIFGYIFPIIVLISIIICVKYMPKVEKNNYKRAGLTVLIVLVVHTFIPFTLGTVNKELTWSNWRNPREIYDSFNDNNKSMKVSGFYEYMIRSAYITFIKSDEEITQEEMVFLDESYNEELSSKNQFTGLFKDKNLILVQLEGTDNWLLNKNDTPTLYSMMNSGYNFANHYSFYNGGGSTFNSEFAVNTGFLTPISYVRNAYTFNKNNFPNSLAKLFKKEGYSVNAFHMNTGEYYSRKVNYLNWGYDNYYSLIETKDYKDNSYHLDRELILNEKFNKLMFPEEGKFVDYIIAYSGHLPFTNTKGVCKMLYELDLKEKYGEEVDLDIEFKQMTEEECVRRQARETDYMMELLVQNLKEKNLLDNTVIVVFTDHYLYTLENQALLDKYKTTSNNLINKTPFFIWSNSIKPSRINKVTSQLNILPTLLNLYGFSYNKNNYIQTDALDKKYSGLVFFSDYSWYDGNVYVDGGKVTNNKNISQTELEDKSYRVNYLIKKNDLTLKYNYFKTKQKASK